MKITNMALDTLNTTNLCNQHLFNNLVLKTIYIWLKKWIFIIDYFKKGSYYLLYKIFYLYTFNYFYYYYM